MHGVRHAAQDVEFRGILRIQALERDRARSDRDVDAGKALGLEGLPVDADRARPPYVYRAQLALLQEECPPGLAVIRQLERARARARSTDKHPVEVGEVAVQRTGREEVRDEEGLPQRLRVHVGDFSWMRHSADRGINHGASIP